MKRPVIRRRIITTLSILSLALILLPGCRPHPPLNLVMICIDTVRYDSFMQTSVPDALDGWLERAQVYDNAVATGPWTIPSVASALTGLLPVEHGAGRFEGEVANLDTDPPSGLAAEARTVAEILSEQGIRSGAFVTHPFFTAGLGLDQGFEVLKRARTWVRDVENFRAWQRSLEPSERFFAYLHFMEAHDLHKANTPKLIERLAGADAATRQDVRDRSSRQACRDENHRRCYQNQVYNLAVLELRAAIASILADLEESGLLDQTVVLVYSDHGEEFWEHRAQQTEAAEDPRGKFGFGHGQSMYQELLHVPLLAWHPRLKGTRHAATVSLVDIPPTVMQWLGLVPADSGFSGEPLPDAQHRRKGQKGDRVAYASGIAYGLDKVATRSGQLKSVYTLRDDRFEFYDLAADPEENSPLEDQRLLMTFDTLTGDYLEQPSRYAVASSQFSGDQLEELKAVGYLQGAESRRPPGREAAPPAATAETGESETPTHDQGPSR